MSDCRNPHLSAYDRAEIEDAERNTKAAQTVQGCVDDENTMRDVTREFRDEWKAKAKKRDFKDEMADLLFRIQIPLNVQREYLKKVSHDSEMDSRERLEAEIRYEYNGSISNEAEQIIEWLDRQAAITKMEMQAKVDELEAKRASWTCCYHIDRLAKLQAQRDRYRDLLSKAVDEAQSIVKLMEVES